MLPPTDTAIRTHVRPCGDWFGFQEFMIGEGAKGPVEGVEVLGVSSAQATPEVLEALERARAIVIGPVEPGHLVIRPILAVGGVADALRATEAPVVAVSPLVRGKVLKGPHSPSSWSGPATRCPPTGYLRPLRRADRRPRQRRAGELRPDARDPTSRWATPTPGAGSRARPWNFAAALRG